MRPASVRFADLLKPFVDFAMKEANEERCDDFAVHAQDEEIPQRPRLGGKPVIPHAPAIDFHGTGHEVVPETCLVAMKEFERRPGRCELAVELRLEEVVDNHMGHGVVDSGDVCQSALDMRTNRALVDAAHDVHLIRCHCTG